MATTTSLSEMSATIAHRLHVEPLRSVGTGVPWRSGTLWRFYMGLLRNVPAKARIGRGGSG